MSSCSEKITSDIYESSIKNKTKNNAPQLILEIDALLVMAQLNAIASIRSPINRGMAFLTDSLLKEMLRQLLKSGKINDSRSWPIIIETIAQEIEIYDVFSRDDILQCLASSLRFMLGTDNLIIKIEPSQSRLDPDLMIPVMHRKISSLLETETGICVHYASYAIHYLIQAGIRPVSSIWLFNKESFSVESPIGHNIVVIGLQNQDDYVNLANMDALIFDYWNGGIYSTRNAFSSGGPLEKYDESKMILMLHVNKDDVNPFPPLTPNLDVKNRLKTDSVYLSQCFLNIIHERIAKGEVVKDIASWIADYPDDEIKQTYLDLNDSERLQNNRDVIDKLERYEKSARVIQSSWRFFSKKRAQLPDTSCEHIDTPAPNP